MNASLISHSSVAAPTKRRSATAPATRLVPAGLAPAQTETLPLRAGVAANAWGPRWMFIAGGAIVGGLLLSLPGAVLGGLAGYLLTR